MAQVFRTCCDLHSQQIIFAVFKVDEKGDRNLMINGEPAVGDSPYFATAYASVYADDLK